MLDEQDNDLFCIIINAVDDAVISNTITIATG